MMSSGQILKVARVAVEAAAAFFITAAWMNYGFVCLQAGRFFDSLQLVPAALGLSLAVLAFWLAVTLFFGRIYCSTVCPLGAALDLAARARPRPAVYRFRRPKFQAVRWIIVAVAVLLFASGWLFPRYWVDPYGLYTTELSILTSGRVTLATAVASAVAVLLWWLGYRRGRLFCTAICPVGTLLGVFARRSVFRMTIDTDRCTQCRRCVDVCKAGCIDLGDHVCDMGRCVVCFNCVAACEDGALRYTAERRGLSTPMMQRLSTPYNTTIDNTITIEKEEDETVS